VTKAQLWRVLAVGLLVVGSASLTQAADEDPDAWHVTFTPYAWAPGLYGDVTVRARDAELDANFIDILDNTETVVGLAGRLEVTRGRFGIFGDAFYTKASVDNAGAPGVDVTSRMWFIDFGGLVRVLDTTDDRVPGLTVDLYGGGRYSNLELDLDTAGEPSLTRAKSWIDPIVGARVGVHFSEHVFLLVGGDIGGFGVGSDFAWSVLGLIGYRWQGGPVEWAILAGYKALAQDYTSGGSGTGRFRWDVLMHGPVLGFSIRF
jgi:hypothetical protein